MAQFRDGKYRFPGGTESLFATMEKDPLPGTFQGLLPSALVEGGMEWEGRRERQMPQPLWMLHEDLASFWPAPHPILCFPPPSPAIQALGIMAPPCHSSH